MPSPVIRFWPNDSFAFSHIKAMVILAHSKKRICNWYYSIMIRPCCFCPIKILSIKTTPKSINISLFIDCHSIFLSCRPDASGYFPVARHVCTCISWSAPLQYAQPEPIVPDRTIRANRAIRTNRSYIMLCVNVVSLKPSINEVFLLIFMSVASISIIITLPLISNQSSLLWYSWIRSHYQPWQHTAWFRYYQRIHIRRYTHQWICRLSGTTIHKKGDHPGSSRSPLDDLG